MTFNEITGDIEVLVYGPQGRGGRYPATKDPSSRFRGEVWAVQEGDKET